MWQRVASFYARGNLFFTPTEFSSSNHIMLRRWGVFDSIKKHIQDFEIRRDRLLDEALKEDSNSNLSYWRTDAQAGNGEESTLGYHANKILAVHENPNACPRSVLFVPGIRKRALEKISSLSADAYILDLEDSIGPSHKQMARENIRSFVNELLERSRAASDTEKVRLPRLILRINSPDFDSKNSFLDLELVGELGTALEGVAVPKVTVKSYDIIQNYIHPDHQLWAIFETAQSVEEASRICGSKKYKYALMGYNDLAANLGLPLSVYLAHASDGLQSHTIAGSTGCQNHELYHQEFLQRLPLFHCASKVLISARMHGLHFVDGVCNYPGDLNRLRKELSDATALGFEGKSLISPSHIELTNRAFTPTLSEVEWAKRIKEAMHQSKGNVTMVDGKMVERLHVEQAEQIILRHLSAEVSLKSVCDEETTTKTP